MSINSFEVRYCVIGAGPVGHPEKVFNRICKERGWEVVEATPYSIGDCWIFKVRCSGPARLDYLPSYIKVVE